MVGPASVHSSTEGRVAGDQRVAGQGAAGGLGQRAQPAFQAGRGNPRVATRCANDATVVSGAGAAARSHLEGARSMLRRRPPQERAFR